MNNIEKSLAEKFMYAIHIKNDKNVIGYYLDYRKYTRILGDKKDDDLLNKVNNNFKIYFDNKINLVR